MAENVIRVRGSRARILEALRQIPREARGTGDAAQAMLVRLGVELLSKVREAFVVKARGGTDESGLKWEPLKRSTVAYSRRHPGLPGPATRAGRRPSFALTPEGRKLWWRDYSIFLARYKGDKAHAAAVAWMLAKNAGETTLLDKYGNTPVEILRDTGLLLNSLTPGVRAKSGQENQVFRVGAGEVVVGTNRKQAGVHHYGSRSRGIPQRRLWPEPSRWPSRWWQGLLEQAKQGIVEIMLAMIRRRT